MTISTLHYLFSSIPQILGATSAVLIAAMFFRIEKINRILVGDGKTVIRRFREGESAYKILSGWRLKRLEDAVDRENIAEIKEIIKFLNDSELKEGITKNQRPRGFQFMYGDRFSPTEQYLINLKSYSLGTILLKIATIIVSILYLSLVDLIIDLKLAEYFTISALILFFASLISTILLIFYGLQAPTIYEDLNLRDEIININKANNNLP